MNTNSPEPVETSFTSDLIDLGAVSLGTLRKLDSAQVRVALDRVVQQTGRPTKSIAGCSQAHGID
ncbi:hypothetical protein [Actinophytocola sp.]|uniref:hypothetical protein n=1 Tax=Actinophytocola sp. TaxID=1872138 RepID=UPI003D6A84E2